MADGQDEVEMSFFVPLGFIALIVWTVSWGRHLVDFVSSGRREAKVEQSQDGAKASKKKNSGKKDEATTATQENESSNGERWKALVIIVAWILFVIYLASDYGMGQVQTGRYDPYKILNVAETVTKAELKKIYRDLSKEYHPDRLAGKSDSEKSVAEKQFVHISKAYKTLTNEESMNNWLQYGHPDGPRSITVSMGIPAWMKKPENAGLILLAYVFALGGGGYLFVKHLNKQTELQEPEKDKKKKN